VKKEDKEKDDEPWQPWPGMFTFYYVLSFILSGVALILLFIFLAVFN